MAFASAMAAIFLLLTPLSSHADEAQIRKTLAQRMDKLAPIEDLKKSPVPGLYEFRVGTAVFYTDEQASHLIVGQVFDTKTGVNVTSNLAKQGASKAYQTLPFADALTTVQGDGSRHLTVFADPNCGYCKRLEKDLQGLKNVTIRTFLYPILGQDSVEKSRNIFCSANASSVWQGWMTQGKAIPPRANNCPAVAIDRNVALGQRLRVTGTPAIFFPNGEVIRGAADLAAIEKQLTSGPANK